MKSFPVTLVPESTPGKFRKIPLIKDWRNKATTDVATWSHWREVFGDRIKAVGIPTGPVNNLLVVDFDPNSKPHEFQLPPTMTQKTPRGVHYFFKYPDDGKLYGNKTSAFEGVDIRGEGGFVAWYGTALDVPIAEAPLWLLQACEKAPRDMDRSILSMSPEMAKDEVEKALSVLKNCPVGQRNNEFFKASVRVTEILRAGGLDEADIASRLKEVGTALGLSESEMDPTMRSGADTAHKKPLIIPLNTVSQPEGWTPPFLRVQDMMDETHLRRPQIFKDWSSLDISIISGDGGSFKSTLLLCESICMAMGSNFLNFKNLRSGKTLYLTGEDSVLKLSAIIGKISQGLGFGSPDLLHHISQCIAVKKENNFPLISRGTNGLWLPSQHALSCFYRAIEAIEPTMVVVDPISKFWGSEAALNDMGLAISAFFDRITERYPVNITMVNHMSMASSKSKDMSQFAGRGGTGLPSHARVVKAIRKVEPQEFFNLTKRQLGGRKAVMCRINKFSDGSPNLDKDFLIIRRGYEFERVDLKSGSDKDRTEADVLAFIKQSKDPPSRKALLGHFENLQATKLDRLLYRLDFDGRIETGENPNPLKNDKVYYPK